MPFKGLVELLAELRPEGGEFEERGTSGERDWDRFPPSLEEVKDWRAGQDMQARQGMMISLNGIGAARLFAMSDAEKRFKEMGLQ